MSTTAAILKQIELLGWRVREHRINGIIEFHAIEMEKELSHVARCNDGDGEEETYRAAVMLAQAVGMELEDG
jgi:hypothetical protein